MCNPFGGKRMTYANAKIPGDLAETMDILVEKSGMGYRSRGEFVIEAVCEKILQIAKTQEVSA